MPTYIYSDGKHRQEVTHRMLYSTGVLCDVCGAEMHRVPQPVAVVWGQNPPSKGGLNPLVEELIRTKPQRRERFARMKEEHVNRTEGES